jgi:hypothetical protein
MSEPILEVRVPISPTPDFFRRVHCMAASLRQLGGMAAEHQIAVFVGGDEEPRDLYEILPWSQNYPIVWRWVAREAFRRHNYWETSHEVFRHQSRARYVMCADADVIFVHDFSDLLTKLEHAPAVAGVIAHVSPFAKTAPREMWQRLCDSYSVPVPPSVHEHTGWGFMATDPQYRYTPVYFNFGMVLAPREMMEKISVEMATADNLVDSQFQTFFRFQIALTLAIQKQQLPAIALPLRYNFPNDPRFDKRYPDELADIRILHYLRCEIIHRERDFASLANLAALVRRRDLIGSNEVLRRRIEDLYFEIASEERKTEPSCSVSDR